MPADLLNNFDRLHTTILGAQRISHNLGLNPQDSLENVVMWCKQAIKNSRNIIRKGKNWYAYVDNIVITINAHSFTIITAHQLK